MRLHRFLLLLLLPCFCFCEKGEDIFEEEEPEIEISEELKPAAERFRELTKDAVAHETFLFFTDPHMLGLGGDFSDEVKDNLVAAFPIAKEAYDLLKLNFCLCGGDWLNNSDTQDVAKQKLLFADKQMKSMFSRYYKMLGNHDTNYQGIVSVEDSSRGDLPRTFIDNEYFQESASAYYSFKGSNTRFYVLDSGSDWQKAMDDYRWEQLLWLANQLKVNKDEHVVLCIHMFYTEGKVIPMSSLLIDICDAFNSRKEITLNGQSFNYADAKGTVHAVLSGHNHEDALTYLGKEGTIPVVQTRNLRNTPDRSSFDICVMDYKTGLLNLIRVGDGENREVKMNVISN